MYQYEFGIYGIFQWFNPHLNKFWDSSTTFPNRLRFTRSKKKKCIVWTIRLNYQATCFISTLSRLSTFLFLILVAIFVSLSCSFFLRIMDFIVLSVGEKEVGRHRGFFYVFFLSGRFAFTQGYLVSSRNIFFLSPRRDLIC